MLHESPYAFQLSTRVWSMNELNWLWNWNDLGDKLYKKVSYECTFKWKKCTGNDSSKSLKVIMLKHVACVIDDVGVTWKNKKPMFHEIQLSLYAMWYKVL